MTNLIFSMLLTQTTFAISPDMQSLRRKLMDVTCVCCGSTQYQYPKGMQFQQAGPAFQTQQPVAAPVASVSPALAQVAQATQAAQQPAQGEAVSMENLTESINMQDPRKGSITLLLEEEMDGWKIEDWNTHRERVIATKKHYPELKLTSAEEEAMKAEKTFPEYVKPTVASKEQRQKLFDEAKAKFDGAWITKSMGEQGDFLEQMGRLTPTRRWVMEKASFGLECKFELGSLEESEFSTKAILPGFITAARKLFGQAEMPATVAKPNMSFGMHMGKAGSSDKDWSSDSHDAEARLGLTASGSMFSWTADRRGDLWGLRTVEKGSQYEADKLVIHYWMSNSNSGKQGTEKMGKCIFERQIEVPEFSGFWGKSADQKKFEKKFGLKDATTVTKRTATPEMIDWINNNNKVSWKTIMGGEYMKKLN